VLVLQKTHSSTQHFAKFSQQHLGTHSICFQVSLGFVTVRFFHPPYGCDKGAEVSDLEDLNYYEILGISPKASPAAIRKAWKLEASIAHPDRHVKQTSEVREKFARQMVLVNRAFQVLSNEKTRRNYDIEEGLIAAKCSKCGQDGSLRPGPENSAVAVCDSCYNPPPKARVV